MLARWVVAFCEATRRGSAICQIVIVGALIVASAARADDEGYLDNWAGDIKIELRAVGASGPPTTFPIPLDSAVQPLRDSIAEPWRQALNQTCDEIRARFQVEVHFTKWLTCQIAAEGELRGRISSPNSLDLKYVLKGNRVRFKKAAPNPLGAEPDPTVQADFDIILRLTIVFDTTVDGRRIPASFENSPVPPAPADPPNAAYLVQPAKLINSIVTFGGARFTTEGVLEEKVLFDLFGGEAQLRDAERRMNAASSEVPLSAVDLRETNRSLHRGANRLTALIRSTQPALGTPTPFFNLSVFIGRDRSLVIRYQRFGNPPEPLRDCKCSEKCDNEVNCSCAGAGIVADGEQIFLQREKPVGTWVPIGHDIGFSVTGTALGAHTGETLTHRMCRVNQFGSKCTAPFSFVYTDIGTCPPPPPPPDGGAPPTCLPNCLR